MISAQNSAVLHGDHFGERRRSVAKVNGCVNCAALLVSGLEGGKLQVLNDLLGLVEHVDIVLLSI